jgi:hypothetical protein
MVTANEVRVSERHPESYHLYRVYEFARDPRAYVLPGSLRERCRLEPRSSAPGLGGRPGRVPFAFVRDDDGGSPSVES